MSILSQSFVGRRDIFRSMPGGKFPWNHAGLATSLDAMDPEPLPDPAADAAPGSVIPLRRRGR